jgi:hypothetical protein
MSHNGTRFVDLVNNGHRPNHEQIHVVDGTRLVVERQRILTQRYQFALGRQTIAYHQRPYRRSDDVRLVTHVGDAEHELVLTVALTNDGRPAEENRLGTTLRSRDLGKDQTSGDHHHQRSDDSL